jgi:hypothetical protein
MVVGMLCFVVMLFGKQEMAMGDGEADCEFEPSDTGLKGDLYITSFVSLLGLLIPCLGFNQKIFRCYIVFLKHALSKVQ